MDYMGSLTCSSRGFYSIWFIIDRLINSSYFIPVQSFYNTKKLVQFYVREKDHLHEVPLSIISNRGPYSPQAFGGIFRKS